MEFLSTVGHVVGYVFLMYMMYIAFEMLMMPIIIAVVGSIYIPLGKRKEFDAMVAEYKAKKMKRGKFMRKFSGSSTTTVNMGHSVNPNTGRPMISGTSSDVGGNSFGTGRWK